MSVWDSPSQNKGFLISYILILHLTDTLHIFVQEFHYLPYQLTSRWFAEWPKKPNILQKQLLEFQSTPVLTWKRNYLMCSHDQGD